MNIVIIGRGNVATNLDYAFRKKGVACQMVSSREDLEHLPAANTERCFCEKDGFTCGLL